MSSNFLDANDFQRLSREEQLTEQAPRVEEKGSDDMSSIFDGMLAAFERRLKREQSIQ